MQEEAIEREAAGAIAERSLSVRLLPKSRDIAKTGGMDGLFGDIHAAVRHFPVPLSIFHKRTI
jgi:hypothetical protein